MNLNKLSDNPEIQKALITMADLLTDICEESPKDNDTNNKLIKPLFQKKFHQFLLKNI